MGLRARLCVAAHTNSRTFFFKDYVLAFYNNRTKYEENHQSEFHFVNNQVDHLFRLLIKKKKKSFALWMMLLLDENIAMS